MAAALNQVFVSGDLSQMCTGNGTHPEYPVGQWDRFLNSRAASLLTHGSLVALTSILFTLLWHAPFWLAFVPGVLLTHRIGVLLHEYLHGIPFRRNRDNLAVYGFFDGLMLMFGLLELFRGTHLAHHRWLNSEGDSGFRSARRAPERSRVWAWIAALEAVQHFVYLIEAFRGRQRYVRMRRVCFGLVLSIALATLWWQAGREDIVLKVLALNAFTTLVPVSLRGAVEHHSVPGDPGFANEYRVWIFLFNLNRHVHHHEDVRCPWYRLEFRTRNPLSARHYFTHWFRVYVKHDLALMRPISTGVRIDEDQAAWQDLSVAEKRMRHSDGRSN
jgi:fatty acid desaturase